MDDPINREKVAPKENSGIDELQRNFTAGKIQKCITKLHSHKPQQEQMKSETNSWSFGGKWMVEIIVRFVQLVVGEWIRPEQDEGMGGCNLA